MNAFEGGKVCDAGFTLYNPQTNLYVQFDKNTIVFKTMEEVAEFKQKFRKFFTGTQAVPQIVAVDEAFVTGGACVMYSDISEELRKEAEEEVEDMYGGE